MRESSAVAFHHGDCIGADADAHGIAIGLGIPVHIHPPRYSSKRAFCKGAVAVYGVRDYLDRNHDIVNASGVILATPKGDIEELRSGTWATIRYARRDGRRLAVVCPSGEIRRKNWV